MKIKPLVLIGLWYVFFAGMPAALLGAESALWQQFKQAKLTGAEPTLPDFSYAGYDYSESPLPDTSEWDVFNVTDYGAVPDDGNYDDAAIQATIDAAAANGGGIVFFPPGRFMVSPNNDITETIRISSSNILLKGSGSGSGGTEIFMDKMKVNNGRYMFEVKPAQASSSTLTTVVADAPRESYQIEVANASNLHEGQRIILRADSVPFGLSYYAPLSVSSNWTRLHETGFNLRELHTVASINGNTVTLREPLHITLDTSDTTIQVRSYPVIKNVGIEDILFKGNWNSYPESFVHHKNDIHDYAWNALRFDRVVDSWLRNCEFKDWNQCVYFDGCAAFTVENVSFTGKMGHMSIHTRRSYGILIKDCVDTAGHWHGPGLGYWGTGTVYLRFQMAGNQRIDSHSGSPYANLMDNVTGGHFDGNGGPLVSYPHHGRHFVAWNFKVSGGPNSYNFWPSNRNGHTFAEPIFVGLQGKGISMTNHGINESPGKAVEPASLFEAQLQLRLGPTLEPTGATDVTGTSAKLIGKVLSAGQDDPTIRIYWGATDGGTDPGAWEHVIDLGTRGEGPVSANITGLTPGQSYHFRLWGSNAYYDSWSSGGAQFTAPGPPSMIATGASGLLANRATLNGFLDGGNPADVIVLWDSADRGTHLGNWPTDRRIFLSDHPAGSVSAVATGLVTAVPYTYRMYASNALGEAWSGAGMFQIPAMPVTLLEQAAPDHFAVEAEIVTTAGRIVDFDKDGLAWTVRSSVSGAFGEYIQATDHGSRPYSAYQSIAKYHLRFTEPGTYYFYSRNRGTATNADSFYLSSQWSRFGPLRTQVTTSDSTWAWRTQGSFLTVTPEQVGRMLTLNLHTREQNSQVDRFVLHKDNSLGSADLNALFVTAPALVNVERSELFFETFETDGLGSRYTLTGTHSGSRWLRDDGTVLNQLDAPTGVEGSWYFGGKNLGGEHTIHFQEVFDATAYRDLQLELRMGNGSEGFQAGEFLNVEVRFGEGPWQELVSFTPYDAGTPLAEGGHRPGNAEDEPSATRPRPFGSYLLPEGEGKLSLRLAANSGSANRQLAFDNLRITGTPKQNAAYAAWAEARISDPTRRGFEDDADIDGVPNVVEAFLGTNPESPTGNYIREFSVSGNNSITFEHSRNDAMPEGITGRYYWSPDLVEWYASGAGPVGGPVLTFETERAAGKEIVTATATAPVARCFIKLKVTVATD